MPTTDSIAARLYPMLEPLQTRIKDMQCRIVSSAFNSTDPTLCAFPLARDWQWPSLEDHLKRFKAETLILQLPSFWQVEPFVHFAAKASGTAICNIETQNYPLDKASIRFASANAVLAESTEAAAIAEYLHKEQVALPPYWLVLYAADTPKWQLPQLLQHKSLEVAEEVHLVPGVPLLIQCKELVAAHNGGFHHSELFTWKQEAGRATISSTEFLFNINDLPMPFLLEPKGACACGKDIVTKAA